MLLVSRTIKLLIGSIILFIVTLGGYYLLNSQIDKKNKQAAVILSEIDSTLSVDQQLRSVQNLIKNTEEDREKLNSYIINDEGIVDFLEIIEGLERYTGAAVSIKTIGKSDTGEIEYIEQLELNFTAEGSWKSVYHFFTLLEALPYRVDMSRAQFNNIKGGTNNENEWRGIFILKAAKIK